MKRATAVLCAGLLALGGCATIVGDRTQLIGLTSTPDQASITVIDEKGQKIFAGTTPTTVTLQKSDGTYFGGKNYKVRVEKPGFRPVDVALETRVNGWYIGGNLIFGGLVGWLIVDPLTGAMYNIAPENVNASLQADGVSYNRQDRTLSVVLIENVPTSLRQKMVRVN